MPPLKSVAIAPGATVSRLRAPFQPLIATELDRGRAHLRRQLKDLFAPELGWKP